MVAFSFGLLHGLGFAGALAEMGLPQHAIPLALLFFNVGVEIGQLIFIAVVLGAIVVACRMARRLRIAAAGVVVARAALCDRRNRQLLGGPAHGGVLSGVQMSSEAPEMSHRNEGPPWGTQSERLLGLLRVGLRQPAA